MDNLLTHAKAYVDRGWSVIPVGTNKIPIINWKEFQERIATIEELEDWFSNESMAGIGIVTGSISGIVVIDVDKKSGGLESIKNFSTPLTPIVQTGGGGFHYYYACPKNARIKTCAGDIAPGIDIRGEGGYVVAPPSLHLSGNRYEWATSFDDAELAELPSWVIEAQEKIGKRDFIEIAKGVPEGRRHDSATSLIGKLLHNRPVSEVDLLWEMIRAWNEQNPIPLPESELRTTFDGIASKEFSKRQSSSTPTLFDNPIRMGELLAEETSDETSWIIKDLFTVGSIAMLSGDPASFKTWVMLHLAVSVASGKPLFGKFDCASRSVLVISEEDHRARISARLKKLEVAGIPSVTFHIYTGFKIDNESHINSLITAIERENIGLVCIDSFRRVLSGEENDSTSINNAFNLLRTLSKLNVTVLLTHHHRKQDEHSDGRHSMRGSSDILAAVDSHIMIRKIKGRNRLRLTQMKQRDASEIEPFEVEIIENDSKISLEFVGEAPKKDAQKDIAKIRILSILANEVRLDRNQLAEQIGSEIGGNNLIEGLKELCSEGKISVEAGAHNKKLYFLRQEAVNQNVSDTLTECVGSQEDVSGIK
ncbi:MAG: bifunctional DNA primase/polymerase [bacterium]|nr:bifunctional DNA primase/polymerase [bacterium]